MMDVDGWMDGWMCGLRKCDISDFKMPRIKIGRWGSFRYLLFVDCILVLMPKSLEICAY